MDMIARCSHDHPTYPADNEAVYHKVEEATRNTKYASTIKPFQRRKDGRGAFISLIAQHAGEDKWLGMIKQNESVLHSVKWKGQSNFTLEKHCERHRHAYTQLVLASDKVPCQLPAEHSRVTYLLDSIECKDAGLLAAMSGIKQNKDDDGPWFNFEACVANLLPEYPVSKRRLDATKRPHGQVSSVTFEDDEIEVSALKSGIGKTGVHFCWYKLNEYKELAADQKQELYQWRNTPEGKKVYKDAMAAHNKSRNSNSNKKPRSTSNMSDKHIAALFDKKVVVKMKAATDEKTKEDERDAAVVAAIEKIFSSKTPSQANVSSLQSSLKTILRRARNGDEWLHPAAATISTLSSVEE